MGNDPEVEKAGSTFAAECATAHWKSLTSAVTSGSPYSPVSGSDELDQKLYRSFRASFSPAAFDVGSFSRTTIHNEFTLPTWRALMLGWDGRIEVFNLITLLRTDCLMSYEDARAAGVEKLLLVPRVQFLMIEVARQRENCYDCLGVALHEAQLRQSANALRSALEFVLPSSRQASPSGAMAQAREAMDRLSKLAPPNEAALRATRAGRLLARVVKRSKIKDATDGRGPGERDGSTVSERLVATATATLTKWRAAVEVRNDHAPPQMCLVASLPHRACNATHTRSTPLASAVSALARVTFPLAPTRTCATTAATRGSRWERAKHRHDRIRASAYRRLRRRRHI